MAGCSAMYCLYNTMDIDTHKLTFKRSNNPKPVMTQNLMTHDVVQATIVIYLVDLTAYQCFTSILGMNK